MKHTTKTLGIWMDHANSIKVENTTKLKSTTSLLDVFTQPEKIESVAKHSDLSSNKEPHDPAAFYRQIGKIIPHFDQVILFGPAAEKSELYHMLKANQQFDNIKIETKTSDIMTVLEQKHFITHHFSPKR